MRAALFTLATMAILAISPALRSQAQDQLKEANSAASVLLIERLKSRDPEGWRLISRCPRSAILLVDGRHDHTDRVLRPLGLRFTQCQASSFARRSLRGVRLLIIDCPGQIGDAGVKRAEAFVARGGTLLTTDWALLHVLQRGFGNRVRHNGVQTRDDVVRVDTVARHPLTRSVFPRGRTAAWWIEHQSYPIDRLRSSGMLTVLFSSSELGRKYGSGIVGVTFSHGRGSVVHVISHMYLQRTHLTRAWERKSARSQAAELDLPTASSGYGKLLETGTLDRVKAGHLNATLSIQQFLMNIVLQALRPGHHHHPSPPRPLRPAPRLISPRASYQASTETHLFKTPGGEAFLRIAKGLRLQVIRSEPEWILVSTPAGQQGWIPSDQITR